MTRSCAHVVIGIDVIYSLHAFMPLISFLCGQDSKLVVSPVPPPISCISCIPIPLHGVFQSIVYNHAWCGHSLHSPSSFLHPSLILASSWLPFCLLFIPPSCPCPSTLPALTTAGAPMGCAPIAHVLWSKVMKYDPADPHWVGLSPPPCAYQIINLWHPCLPAHLPTSDVTPPMPYL